MNKGQIHLRDRLILDPKAGLVQFVDGTRTLLANATAIVTYLLPNDKRTISLAQGAAAYGVSPDRVSLSASDQYLELSWQIALGEDTVCWVEVRNIGKREVRLQELGVLNVAAELGGRLGYEAPLVKWRFFQHGWQSWSPSFARRTDDGIYIDPNTDDYRIKHQPHPLPQAIKSLSSEWFTVITPGPHAIRGDAPLLLGFITAHNQLSEIRLDLTDGEFQALRATSYADDHPLAPGESYASERLLIRPDNNPLELLRYYAARLGEAMGARVPERVPTGWCTWYYFYGEDRTHDIEANLKSLERYQLPLEYVLIDDGYQSAIGDWLTPNLEKYPEGMAALGERIRATGRKLAVWTAPFAAEAHSRLCAEHPDWILRDAQGTPVVAWQHWGVDTYALDLTNPQVAEWLRDVYRTMRQEWGCELFKLDFVYAAALPGVRHNPRLTRAQAVRRGLEIIRETVGDAFILGCGAPLATSVGLVDGMRVGPDVHMDWEPLWADLSYPSARNSLHISTTRSFMHRHLWLNDPDCLLVRHRGDESSLVLNEMRTMTSLVGLLGGLTVNSDNLTVIRPGRLKYLRQVLPPSGESAIPVDLFERERPEVLMLPVQRPWGRWWVVGLVNWEDKTRETTLHLSCLGLPDGEYHIYHYWHRRYLGRTCDHLTIKRHQPHETVLLLIKPVSTEPAMLTSTFHVTQGAVEIQSVEVTDGRLRVILNKRGVQKGKIIFCVPKPYRALGVKVSGRRQKLVPVAEEIYSVGLRLVDAAVIDLLYEH